MKTNVLLVNWRIPVQSYEKKLKRNTMQDQKLSEYLKFDEVDLASNRKGQLTEKQKARIAAELISERTRKTIFAIFLFFLAAVGLVIAVGAWILNSSWGLRIGFGLGFGVVWPLVYVFFAFMVLPESFNTQLELDNVRGRTELIRTESRDSRTHASHIRHFLQVGGRRFVVDWKLAEAITAGEEYIFYFLKNSQKIISAERI